MKKMVLLAILLVTGASSFAQSFSIDWSKISGGGGSSTNGQFSLSGTIGQHDAGGAMSGGNYSLAGGFWSGISLVQTLDAPQLHIQFSGLNAIVSWAADQGAGFSLEEANSLTTPASWGLSSATLATNANTISATVPANAGIKFYRLHKP